MAWLVELTEHKFLSFSSLENLMRSKLITDSYALACFVSMDYHWARCLYCLCAMNLLHRIRKISNPTVSGVSSSGSCFWYHLQNSHCEEFCSGLRWGPGLNMKKVWLLGVFTRIHTTQMCRGWFENQRWDIIEWPSYLPRPQPHWDGMA